MVAGFTKSKSSFRSGGASPSPAPPSESKKLHSALGGSLKLRSGSSVLDYDDATSDRDAGSPKSQIS